MDEKIELFLVIILVWFGVVYGIIGLFRWWEVKNGIEGQLYQAIHGVLKSTLRYWIILGVSIAWLVVKGLTQ